MIHLLLPHPLAYPLPLRRTAPFVLPAASGVFAVWAWASSAATASLMSSTERVATAAGCSTARGVVSICVLGGDAALLRAEL